MSRKQEATGSRIVRTGMDSLCTPMCSRYEPAAVATKTLRLCRESWTTWGVRG